MTCSNLSFGNIGETLILFVDDANPIMTAAEVSDLEALSKQMGIELKQFLAKDGVPAEITTLPSIYFQNEDGRSKYYGRYNNISRIKNFIRTAKLFHQKNEINEKSGVLVWKSGKAEIIVHLKITDLRGDVKKCFDQAAFKQMAIEYVAQGMNQFEGPSVYALSKFSRSFYVNVYPYLANDNSIYLTGELFSPFNCIKPIFTQFSPAIATAKWDKQSAALKEFAFVMESEILRQITTPESGDGFRMVKENQLVKSWEEIGLAMTIGNEEAKDSPLVDLVLPKNWQVENARNLEDPIIIFSFLSPVDNYAGEVKALQGALELSDINSMQGAIAQFQVNIKDVTMGAEDFDDAVQNKMLKMGLFPNASFELTEIIDGEYPLEIGEVRICSGKGKFIMMGISIPIEIDLKVKPFMYDAKTPKLEIRCSFQLPLYEKFKVEGPDGPSPAKDVLQFYMKFNMESRSN